MHFDSDDSVDGRRLSAIVYLNPGSGCCVSGAAWHALDADPGRDSSELVFMKRRYCHIRLHQAAGDGVVINVLQCRVGAVARRRPPPVSLCRRAGGHRAAPRPPGAVRLHPHAAQVLLALVVHMTQPKMCSLLRTSLHVLMCRWCHVSDVPVHPRGKIA